MVCGLRVYNGGLLRSLGFLILGSEVSAGSCTDVTWHCGLVATDAVILAGTIFLHRLVRGRMQIDVLGFGFFARDFLGHGFLLWPAL